MVRFYENYTTIQEENNILQCLENNEFGNGAHFQRRCLSWINERYGTDRIILTASGSQALELAGAIVEAYLEYPSYTVGFSTYSFPSSVNALLGSNVEGILLDIDENGVISESYLKQSIDQLHALVVTNYAGMNSRIDKIAKLCKEKQVLLIEDNALGFLSKEHEKMLGTFGDIGILSFESTKPVSCGEGGAVIINNPDLWELALVLSENGTTKRLHKMNPEISYTWVKKGINCRLSELNAAFLFGQLQHAEFDIIKRKELICMYVSCLKEVAGIIIPVFSEGSNACMFYIKFINQEILSYCKSKLIQKGIEVMAHYGSLRESTFGRTFQYVGKNEAKQFDTLMLRLPLHLHMTAAIVGEICKEIKEAIHSYSSGD